MEIAESRGESEVFLYLSAGKHESFSPVSGPLSFEQPEEAGVQRRLFQWEILFSVSCVPI